MSFSKKVGNRLALPPVSMGKERVVCGYFDCTVMAMPARAARRQYAYHDVITGCDGKTAEMRVLTLVIALSSETAARMNDTFEFSDNFEPFPEGLPRTDWQTRSLACDMADYWVASDGRVARRQFLTDGYFASDTVCFTAYLHQSRKGVRFDLKLVVAHGRVLDIRQEREPDAGAMVDKWSIPVPGPDASRPGG